MLQKRLTTTHSDVNWLELNVSEEITPEFSKIIYEKLNSKKYLGHLSDYGNRYEITKQLCKLNDFIDALYFAHTGRGFSEYFNSWLESKESNILIFKALVLFSAIGFNDFQITYLPVIANKLGQPSIYYPDFIKEYGEFCIENQGHIHIRCVRLFKDLLLKSFDKKAREDLFGSLIGSIGSQLKEREVSFQNDFFEALSKAKNLIRIVGLTKDEATTLLLKQRAKCEHLSYYWIQLGILYRDCNAFEDAENSFENAKNARKYLTYQIAHAIAKNEMEWGIWSISNQPTHSAFLFENGREKMRNLLDDKEHFQNAYSFSAHAYIDMSISYYKMLNTKPESSEWEYILHCMENYLISLEAKDGMTKRLFSDLVTFSKEYGLECNKDNLQEIINRKYDRYATADDYDIDSIPTFD